MSKGYRILFGEDQAEYAGNSKLFPKKLVSAVVSYLQGGVSCKINDKRSKCTMCGADLGVAEKTDGSNDVIWPEKAHHYITAHKVWSPEHTWLSDRLSLGVDEPPPSNSGTSQASLQETSMDIDENILSDETVNPDDLDGSDEDDVIESGDELEGPLDDGDVDDDEGSTTMDWSNWSMPDDILDGMDEPSVPTQVEEDLPLLRHVPPRSSRHPMNGRRRRRPMQHAEQMRHSDDSVKQVDPRPVSSVASAIVAAYPLATMGLANKIVQVAEHLGAHPFDLANLIQFESGRGWRSDSRKPNSSAVGLIQFYPQMTRDVLGTSVDQISRLSEVAQMDLVKMYLDKMRGGQALDTPHKMAMAVFFPSAICWPAAQRFPAEVAQRNPGIYAPIDYVSLMLSTAKLPSSVTGPAHAPSGVAQVAEEGGILGQLKSWFAGFSGTPQNAPQGMVPHQDPMVAFWESGPSLKVQLVNGFGQAFGPGQISAGEYTVNAWSNGMWNSVASVQVEPGRGYRIFLQNGHLQWAEQSP